MHALCGAKVARHETQKYRCSYYMGDYEQAKWRQPIRSNNIASGRTTEREKEKERKQNELTWKSFRKTGKAQWVCVFFFFFFSVHGYMHADGLADIINKRQRPPHCHCATHRHTNTQYNFYHTKNRAKTKSFPFDLCEFNTQCARSSFSFIIMPMHSQRWFHRMHIIFRKLSNSPTKMLKGFRCFYYWIFWVFSIFW